MSRHHLLRIAAGHGLALGDGKVMVGAVQTTARQRGDILVGRAHVGRTLHLHHGACRIVRQLVAGIEYDVVGLAVHAVNDQVAPVVQLVGQHLGGHAADDCAAIVSQIEHSQLAWFTTHSPLHGADDVAALAQGAQGFLGIGMNDPGGVGSG